MMRQSKHHTFLRTPLNYGLVLLIFALVACGTGLPSPTEPPADLPAATQTLVPSNTPVLPTATAQATPTPATTDTPLPSPTPEPTELPSDIVDDYGVPMVLVPEGTFIMGSDNNQAAAKPAHTVFLDTFYIDKFEVTNEMYLACVEAGVCTSGGSSRIYNSTWVGHPVMDVTWYEAQRYCEWRGGRLPTEAEWEKAARGTDERKFPWGNDPVTCELTRYGACGWFTVPVGSHPDGVSPYGAHDMAGNAWEWTLDWYDQDYYTNSPAENPMGPVTGAYKSTRGGAWFYQAGLMTAIWRNQAPPTAAYSYLGLRCMRSP